MPRNYRTTNNNPNGPLFFASFIPGTNGTAMGPALRNLGITTSNFFANNGPYLSEGLYMTTTGTTAGVPIRVFGSSADAGTNRHFAFYGLEQTFMPIKNPENIWVIGPAGQTFSVRGH